MPNKNLFSVVVLSLSLSACAGGAAAPQVPNGMVPYASQGSEVDAIAAGVSAELAAAASASRGRQAQLTQNDCVQKGSPWGR